MILYITNPVDSLLFRHYKAYRAWRMRRRLTQAHKVLGIRSYWWEEWLPETRDDWQDLGFLALLALFVGVALCV